MSTIEKLYKKIIEEDSAEFTGISDVISGYSYNKRFLKSEILGRYIWKNLPLTIPYHTLESMLIENGAIVPIEKKDKIWVQPLHAYGVGVYDDEPPKNIYANPVLGSGGFNLDWYKENGGSYTSSDCVCFENPNHYVMQEVINRYALQLARTESSIDLVLANNNGTDAILAHSQNVADGIRDIYRARLLGKTHIAVTDEIINGLGASYELVENRNVYPDIIQLLTLYNNQLRQFYRKFGINISKDKTQAILSDEAEVDNSILKYKLENGLAERKKWCEMMNNKFGLEIDVEINPALLPPEPEETEEPEEPEEPNEPNEPEEPNEE